MAGRPSEAVTACQDAAAVYRETGDWLQSPSTTIAIDRGDVLLVRPHVYWIGVGNEPVSMTARIGHERVSPQGADTHICKAASSTRPQHRPSALLPMSERGLQGASEQHCGHYE